MEKQIKSKERISKHGEVFSGKTEINAMCDLVREETYKIDSRFLEPACGDGNFLCEILERKLEKVHEKYRKHQYDYERMSLIAISSLYGIEILIDNVEQCRKNLYNIWKKNYKSVFKKEPDNNLDFSIKFIIEKNIVCGNALTFNFVDENANDINNKIIFSEWAFIKDSTLLKSDYLFEDLFFKNSLFNNNKTFSPKFLRKDTMHYKKLKEKYDKQDEQIT